MGIQVGLSKLTYSGGQYVNRTRILSVQTSSSPVKLTALVSRKSYVDFTTSLILVTLLALTTEDPTILGWVPIPKWTFFAKVIADLIIGGKELSDRKPLTSCLLHHRNT